MQVVKANSNLNKFPQGEFIKIRIDEIEGKSPIFWMMRGVKIPRIIQKIGDPLLKIEIESDLDLPKTRQVQILSLARLLVRRHPRASQTGSSRIPGGGPVFKSFCYTQLSPTNLPERQYPPE